MTRRLTTSAVTLVLLASAAVASAQDLPNLFGSAPGGGPLEPDLAFSLHPASARPGDVVTLAIRVTIPLDAWTYSTDESFGGATTIEISAVEGLEAVDQSFQSDHPPKVVDDSILKQRIEKFTGQVVWFRKYRLLADADPKMVAVSGTISGQVCNNVDGCFPFDLPIDVVLGEGEPFGIETGGGDEHPYEVELTPTGGDGKPTPVHWTFRLKPADAQPGDEVTLELTIRLDKRFHIFALSQDRENSGLPTRIRLTGLRGLELLGDGFSESRPFETHQLSDGREQRLFHGEVTWSRKFKVTPLAVENGFGVGGAIRYQFCNPVTCYPANVGFELGRVSASDTVSKEAAGLPGGLKQAPAGRSAQAISARILAIQVAVAMLAGFILNFMPCVLPVIGLKIMSFVEQAGESHRRAFLLNLWFSLGLMSVFAVLATLVAVVGMGWGNQFTSTTFNIVMAAVMFVFALSFLGVWEIPVPGFSSSGSTTDLSRQEGFVGAFSKGVLTTILATPCTGPLLVPAMSWAVKQQSALGGLSGALVTYLVLLSVGLGMAFPYLLIGVFPKLISFLPKPGAWMETFKHVMGFVLLGTVIYPMYVLTGVEQSDVIAEGFKHRYATPTLLFLFGLWAAFWWIGRVPLIEPLRVRLTAWAQGAVIATLVGLLAFGWLYGPDDPFWKPYSDKVLAQALQQNKTVIIDFTADW